MNVAPMNFRRGPHAFWHAVFALFIGATYFANFAGCKKGLESSEQSDVWEAVQLKNDVAIYGRLQDNGTIIEHGRFTDSNAILEVLNRKDHHVRITDGSSTGWVDVNELNPVSMPKAPGKTTSGVENHQLLGQRMTLVEKNTPVKNHKKIEAYLQIGDNITVTRVFKDWLFVDHKNGGWIPQSSVIEYDAAVTHFTNKIQQQNNATYFQNRGCVYYSRDQFDDALKDFNKAVELEPASADHYLYRGNVFFAKGDFKTALDDYTKAIELDEYFTGAYYNRSVNLIQLKRHNDALNDISTCIRINPEDFRSYNARAWIWWGQDKLQNAIEDYSKSIELEPHHAETYLNRGKVMYLAGMTKKAIADFDKYLEFEPNDPNALFAIGEARFSESRFEKAFRDMENAIKYQPENFLFHERLAWILATCPDTNFMDGKKAVEHATIAFDLNKKQPEISFEVLAAAYAADGQFEKAIDYLDKAIKIDSELHKNIRDKMYAAFENRKPYLDVNPK